MCLLVVLHEKVESFRFLAVGRERVEMLQPAIGILEAIVAVEQRHVALLVVGAQREALVLAGRHRAVRDVAAFDGANGVGVGVGHIGHSAGFPRKIVVVTKTPDCQQHHEHNHRSDDLVAHDLHSKQTNGEGDNDTIVVNINFGPFQTTSSSSPWICIQQGLHSRD